MRRITLARSFLTLGMFVIAMLLSLKFPLWGFGRSTAFGLSIFGRKHWGSNMKMRAMLKLNNACAARSAVAGKSISSSQRSNPLTVVSLLDAPDHKNVPRCMLA